MASPAYEQLLVVQELDTSLVQLRHRHANHPLRAEIAAIEQDRSTIENTMGEISERKHGLERNQKRLDDDVASIDTRRAEINTKLYDGSVTATKDLLALQEEATMLLQRQRALEDDELEIMEQVESVGGELSAASAAADTATAEIERLGGELNSELAAISEEEASVEATRGVAAADVPADLLAHYDALRDDFGGVAVARLIGSTCDGCHMALSAVAFDQVKKLPDDAVVTCDQCGRLLIR